MMQVDLGFKVSMMLEQQAHSANVGLGFICKVSWCRNSENEGPDRTPDWLGFFKLSSIQTEARIKQKWFTDINIHASHETTMVGGLSVVRFSITWRKTPDTSVGQCAFKDSINHK